MGSMAICKICKEPISIEYYIPCGHSFCYLCIRRHLTQCNFCPVCHSSPHILSELRPRRRDILPAAGQQPRRTESSLRRDLGKLELWTAGTSDTRRFNELYVLLNEERSKNTSKTTAGVAEAVDQKKHQLVDKNKANTRKAVESLCRMKEVIREKKKRRGS
jgi:hypothetical protein